MSFECKLWATHYNNIRTTCERATNRNHRQFPTAVFTAITKTLTDIVIKP